MFVGEMNGEESSRVQELCSLFRNLIIIYFINSIMIKMQPPLDIYTVVYKQCDESCTSAHGLPCEPSNEIKKQVSHKALR